MFMIHGLLLTTRPHVDFARVASAQCR
ncbi:putative leader peptide [Nonomuraea sp. NPDC049141]